MLKNTLLVGGIETFVTKAFLKGSASGPYWHAAYCLRDGSGGSGSGRLFTPSARFRRLPDAVGKLLLTPWALWRARRHDRASVVHFHGFGASVWAPFAKWLGLKVVSHSHGIEWRRARWVGPCQLLLYLAAWVTCKFSDRILVVSQKEADTYAALFKVGCEVVPGGFDADARSVDLEARRIRTLVIAGRAVPEKRILEVVEAWNRIANHHGYRLKVFCGGDYGGGYLERVQVAVQAGRDVELKGFVPRETFFAELAVASYYVALSSLEGRSLAMLEALAMGNVLVVADTVENREFIPAAGNCFIPADASVPAIALSLERLLAGPSPDAEARKRNACAGASRTWLDVRLECEEVYASL